MRKQCSFKFNCKCAKTLCFGIIMILSTMAYFLGDNLDNLITMYPYLKCDPTNSKCGIRTTGASICLLIFGILGFRFIPLIEKRVKDISKAYSDEEEKKEDKHPFYTTLIEALGLIAEVDAWYTAMTSLSEDNVLKNPCSTLVKIAFWLAYVFIMIALLIYLPLKVVSFNKKKCDCKYCCQYTRLTIVMALTFVIVALHVLADNSEPFDCTFKCGNSTSKCSRDKDIVQLTLTVIVLVLSSIIYILVFCLAIAWVCKWNKEQRQQNNQD